MYEESAQLWLVNIKCTTPGLQIETGMIPTPKILSLAYRFCKFTSRICLNGRDALCVFRKLTSRHVFCILQSFKWWQMHVHISWLNICYKHLQCQQRTLIYLCLYPRRPLTCGQIELQSESKAYSEPIIRTTTSLFYSNYMVQSTFIPHNYKLMQKNLFNVTLNELFLWQKWKHAIEIIKHRHITTSQCYYIIHQCLHLQWKLLLVNYPELQAHC